METEPVISQQFHSGHSMPFNVQQSTFNPFSQHFNQQQQQEHLMMLHQQQLLNQQQNQQDEEMEMADDTTCDMKYSENDMNQMNVTMNSSISHNAQGNSQKSHHEEQLIQQIHQQQFNQQQKFGRLAGDSDCIKNKDKLLDEEESYDESDDDYDDEEDDLDDDYDEHLVHEMMLSAAPEVQNIIKLIVSGFSACATETLRFLVEEENLAVNSPIMVGLIDHLKTQETFLIVNYLKNLKQTQQYQQQLIKQHQQQILASQLLGKQIDPKTIDPKVLNQLQAQHNMQQQQHLKAQQQQQQQQKKQQILNQQQQIQLNHKASASNLVNNPNSMQSNLQNNISNTAGASLSPTNNGPLTSSPINKPFDQMNQLNSINVNNLNHLSNFNNTLHNAFGGSQSSHSSVNSAHNSQSNSPIHTPPLHLTSTSNNFSINNQQQSNQSSQHSSTNPFSSGSFSNNSPNTFFNQTAGVLSFKQPFNDSGFSE